MHHEIPTPILNGLFMLGAAAVTGIIGLFTGEHGGKKRGRIEGEAKFINAVKDAAAIVITRLEAQIEKTEAREAECVRSLEVMKAQIAELMSLGVPAYHVNRDGIDG